MPDLDQTAKVWLSDDSYLLRNRDIFLVSGDEIQTQDLSIMSLLPSPLDLVQSYKPSQAWIPLKQENDAGRTSIFYRGIITP